MWIMVLMVLLLVVTPSFAEPRFSAPYAPDNLFNPANRYNPTTPFAPLNRLRKKTRGGSCRNTLAKGKRTRHVTTEL